MFKSFTLGTRRPDLSPQQHIAYWNGHHAPLAVRVLSQRHAGLQQYAQNHPVTVPGFQNSADGIAETTWDSAEAFQLYLAWRRTDEARELLEDEARFADASARQRLFAVRHVLFDRRGSAQAGAPFTGKVFKSYTLGKRRPDLTPQQHIAYWNGHHGPLAIGILSQRHPGLLQYTQNHPVRLPGFEHSVDGIAETTWDSVESFQAFLAWRGTDDAQELIENEGRFADASARQRLFAVRHVLFDRASS